MKFLSVTAFIVGLLAPAAHAVDFCGQWDSVTTNNNYILYNNLWGSSAATSGSQCTGLDSASGTSIAWHTSWNWAGGNYNVKSFANANLIFTPRRISDIRSIPSTIRYSYSGSNMVANVAYDIFLHPNPGNQVSTHEIMIWLAAYGGAGPLGQQIATVTVAGTSWRLFDGYNGSMRVFSFVAANTITNFSGDAKLFLEHLANGYGLSRSLFVNTLQAGTEPFLGQNARLTVSQFSVVVN